MTPVLITDNECFLSRRSTLFQFGNFIFGHLLLFRCRSRVHGVGTAVERKAVTADLLTIERTAGCADRFAITVGHILESTPVCRKRFRRSGLECKFHHLRLIQCGRTIDQVQIDIDHFTFTICFDCRTVFMQYPAFIAVRCITERNIMIAEPENGGECGLHTDTVSIGFTVEDFAIAFCQHFGRNGHAFVVAGGGKEFAIAVIQLQFHTQTIQILVEPAGFASDLITDKTIIFRNGNDFKGQSATFENGFPRYFTRCDFCKTERGRNGKFDFFAVLYQNHIRRSGKVIPVLRCHLCKETIGSKSISSAPEFQHIVFCVQRFVRFGNGLVFPQNMFFHPGKVAFFKPVGNFNNGFSLIENFHFHIVMAFRQILCRH